MIEQFSIDHIKKYGLSSLVKTVAGIYFCIKVISINKIDIPIFGIEIRTANGAIIFIDYSEEKESKRDEDFFEYNRIFTY